MFHKKFNHSLKSLLFAIGCCIAIADVSLAQQPTYTVLELHQRQMAYMRGCCCYVTVHKGGKVVGNATGFLIYPYAGGSKLPFVTAKHVVDAGDSALIEVNHFEKSDTTLQFPKVTRVKVNFKSNEVYFPIPNVDLAICITDSIKSYWADRKEVIKAIPVSHMWPPEDLMPGLSVIVPSYPIGLKDMGNRPLMMRGSIAGYDQSRGLIILNGLNDSGASGSPVFLDKSDLIVNELCIQKNKYDCLIGVYVGAELSPVYIKDALTNITNKKSDSLLQRTPFGHVVPADLLIHFCDSILSRK